ncbi:MAG: hypothetical protein E5X49_22715 [Mesorhizobium sp.]|uniref:hypothetical protein n=1 Tax=Mesorhizobium sp. TaxID=1871066 RepID=UPI0011FF3398|nr:hypothetical protein [Mesorhizobium sp.]TIQ40641.1 MAG: hypothetical protein E5X49_22715 [Mesorhizobium sp.]
MDHLPKLRRLEQSEAVLAHPQRQEASRGKRRHDQKRHRDADHERQQAECAGDVTNGFHNQTPSTTVNPVASSARALSMILLFSKCKTLLICRMGSGGALMLKLRRKPQKAYPHADRYGEDGRRLYSTYDPAGTVRRTSQKVWVKRARLAATLLTFAAAVLAIIVISALPH